MPLNDQQRDAHKAMTVEQLEYVIISEMITINPDVDETAAEEILKIYRRKVVDQYETWETEESPIKPLTGFDLYLAGKYTPKSED
jgi:hypothetical protein